MKTFDGVPVNVGMKVVVRVNYEDDGGFDDGVVSMVLSHGYYVVRETGICYEFDGDGYGCFGKWEYECWSVNFDIHEMMRRREFKRLERIVFKRREDIVTLRKNEKDPVALKKKEKKIISQLVWLEGQMVRLSK